MPVDFQATTTHNASNTITLRARILVNRMHSGGRKVEVLAGPAPRRSVNDATLSRREGGRYSMSRAGSRHV